MYYTYLVYTYVHTDIYTCMYCTYLYLFVLSLSLSLCVFVCAAGHVHKHGQAFLQLLPQPLLFLLIKEPHLMSIS